MLQFNSVELLLGGGEHGAEDSGAWILGKSGAREGI